MTKALQVSEIADNLDELYGGEEVERAAPMPERGYILPHEIVTDDRFDLRRYDPGDEDEMKRIELLAQNMERDGQLDDIWLSPMDNGRLVLMSGHRRRRAAALINERRAIDHRSLFKLRYSINREGGDLLRKALVWNIQRRDLSAMDLSLNIRRIKAENHWDGFKGSKRVADYLGVSVATVTQHEKFLSAECDEETRRRLHQGVISAQSAFDMMQVPVERRAEVYEAAADIQTDTNIGRAIGDVTARRKTSEEAARDVVRKKIENPAIREAIRETPGARQTPPQPMSRRDIVQFITQFDSPAYGYPNGEVRLWVAAMDALFDGTAGARGEQKAVARFDAMVRQAGRGSGEQVERPVKRKRAR
jgi:ParB-like nuclease domain